ncbi:MAG: 16S rRNA processing protein RimM [Proteobacteria bacterium]|nr:16S rRNA processing protein RimM [Pseudomonadota bacterium]
MEPSNLEKRIIAKVSSAHGIKGEIKIFPLLDSFEALENINTITINDQDFHVESFRPAKQFLILRLKEIKDRNSAEALSGYVFADIKNDLEADEFFIQDLFELRVLNEQGQELGIIENVGEGAQVKIFVKLNETFQKRNSLIIPFVQQFIEEINTEEGFIKIKESEFLLSLNS